MHRDPAAHTHPYKVAGWVENNKNCTYIHEETNVQKGMS